MNYISLIKAINSASTQFQGRAAVAVNQALVMRNWIIGSWIVRFQKQGADRAKYGDRLYARLAGDLARQHVRGCGERMLQQMTAFHQLYPQIAGAIPQTLFAEFGGAANKLFVSRYLVVLPSPEKLRAFLEADRDRIESLMPQAQAAKKLAPRKPKH